MKVTGIIAEYNPFHNGHKYHLEQAREITGADAVVAVISGSVTQRGEAALCDKWRRAEMAVAGGVDLVLELPFAFSCNSAEEFARGGVSILNSLGCVTDLVFGCESTPKTIIAMAEASAREEERFSRLIREGLDQGLSYPAARGQAMMKFADDSFSCSLDRPNDILAVEYARQLVLQGSNMVAHGVLRRGRYHESEITDSGNDSEDLWFSSATAVRRGVMEGRWKDVERAVPRSTGEILKQLAKTEELVVNDGSLRPMDSMILSGILHLGPEGLREIYGCAEGLEYRIWNALPKAVTVEDLLLETASGRYPTARVRRLLMHALVGMTKDRFAEMKQGADRGELYARVLGCNETGAKLLKHIKKTSEKIPVYTNLNRELTEEEKRTVKGEVRYKDQGTVTAAMTSLKLDIHAADVYRMGAGKRLYDGSDFVKGPYIAHKNEKNHK